MMLSLLSFLSFSPLPVRAGGRGSGEGPGVRAAHLEDAVAALEIRLSEDRRELEEAYRPHAVLGHE